MSVKTLASWSAHALSTCSGNPSGHLFKGLAHIGYRERDHSRLEQLVLSCMLQCCLPQSEHKSPVLTLCLFDGSSEGIAGFVMWLD